mgnify:CR=1 FL=1
MTTYSLANTGLSSGHHRFNTVENETGADDVVPLGQTYTITTGTVGGMANAMSQNLPFLAKGLDGSVRWVTLDAERSTPTVPVFKRV